MDDRLKELMQELGNAINESLSDSEKIAASIGEIKSEGYDVFLILEATIGFNKRDENAEDDDEEVIETEVRDPCFGSGNKFKWTSQDHKFLRALENRRRRREVINLAVRDKLPRFSLLRLTTESPMRGYAACM